MLLPSPRSVRVASMVALALVGGCDDTAGAPATRHAPPVTAPAAAPPAPSAGPTGELYSAQRSLMGTVYIIRADAPATVAAPAVEAALDEIERLEGILSEWRPDSEVSRINANAGRSPVHVGPETMQNVRTSLEIARWSDGAFDISWAAMHGIYDFRPESQRIPDLSAIRARLPLIRWQDIAVDETASTVFLRREGMAIGLGGIAKGYALDRAAQILADAGIESFMLFGGGQVLVHGSRGNRPWRVGIQHPRRPDAYFAFLESEGDSIATAGDYEHFVMDANGRRWHHILDPKTGLPVDRSVAVTVIAPTGLLADAVDTALFVLGPERALALLEQAPFRVEAILLDSECRLFTTPGTRERMHFRTQLVDGKLPDCP